jgi:tRNA-binding EMAP/Myf-like protein
MITISDFERIDIRMGRIVRAEGFSGAAIVRAADRPLCL